MCYTVYLSTSSDADLTIYNSDLLRFEPADGQFKPEFAALLQQPNRWHVGSKAGCGCTFRHLHSIELGFTEPVDWAPEEDDEICATGAFYEVISELLRSGAEADCIEFWTDATTEAINRLDVNLADVSREQFRFFENHLFHFCLD